MLNDVTVNYGSWRLTCKKIELHLLTKIISTHLHLSFELALSREIFNSWLSGNIACTDDVSLLFSFYLPSCSCLFFILYFCFCCFYCVYTYIWLPILKSFLDDGCFPSSFLCAFSHNLYLLFIFSSFVIFYLVVMFVSVHLFLCFNVFKRPTNSFWCSRQLQPYFDCRRDASLRRSSTFQENVKWFKGWFTLIQVPIV